MKPNTEELLKHMYDDFVQCTFITIMFVPFFIFGIQWFIAWGFFIAMWICVNLVQSICQSLLKGVLNLYDRKIKKH